jgi:hypothetical protein
MIILKSSARAKKRKNEKGVSLISENKRLGKSGRKLVNLQQTPGFEISFMTTGQQRGPRRRS